MVETETQSDAKKILVNSITFNPTHSHLLVGTPDSFRIYSVDPFTLLHSTVVAGGVKLVQMLMTSSSNKKIHVALVGTGENEAYPTHKIVFWEAGKDRGLSEVNFKTEVLSMSSLDGMLITGLENRVSGFKLKDLSKFV